MPKRKSVNSVPAKNNVNLHTIPDLFRKQCEAQNAKSQWKTSGKSPETPADDSDVEITAVEVLSDFFTPSKTAKSPKNEIKRKDRTRLRLHRKCSDGTTASDKELAKTTDPQSSTSRRLVDEPGGPETAPQQSPRQVSHRLSLRKRFSDVECCLSELAPTESLRKSLSEPPPEKKAKLLHSKRTCAEIKSNVTARQTDSPESHATAGLKRTRQSSSKCHKEIEAGDVYIVGDDDIATCTDIEVTEGRAGDSVSASPSLSSSESSPNESQAPAPSYSGEDGKNKSVSRTSNSSRLTPKKNSTVAASKGSSLGGARQNLRLSKAKKKTDSKASASRDGRNTSEEARVAATNRVDSANDSASSATDADADEAEEPLWTTPYYLENFRFILKAVSEDPANSKLFDEHDQKVLATFSSLPETAQKLYVRLFSRKLSWLLCHRLRYPEISEDLSEALQELYDSGLCLSERSLDDLPAALAALSAADLRSLAKSVHLSTVGEKKSHLVARLLRHSQQTSISAHFGAAGRGMAPVLLQRARKLLGGLVRLEESARAVFVRALMLFSVFDATTDDNSGEGGQSQLFQMLLVNIGQRVYPDYTINKQTVIFKTRDNFLRFTTALQLETDLLVAVEKGNWTGAHTAFLAAQREYKTLSQDRAVLEDAERLPEFLQGCCGLGVLVRALFQGVEVLQRMKDYKAAVSLLRRLLQQPLMPRYRGYWWDRLALNLEAHLKEPAQALDAVAEALADCHVCTGHRLALAQRAGRICKSPTLRLHSRLKEFSLPEVRESPKTYLDGRVLPHTVPGSTLRFLTNDSYSADNPDEVTMCGVEQFVLNHYKTNGYPQGIHGEGGTMSCLFGLFFWDILFSDVPDVFHSKFQALPLDFHTDHFFKSRQSAISARLGQLRAASNQELCEMLTETWTKHQGVLNGCVNWERFDSLQHAQGLVQCMGGTVLAGILERMAHSPRHTRGGFPDLTLWNPETGALKISEVKGPGDRLSHKQILWLDYLLSLGVDAEVSHVRAVGAKKLKPVKSNSVSQE